MSFWDNVGQASLGVTQGFQQGLNIYDQYAKIQDQNRQRQKQATLEDHIATAVKNGEYDDPVNGLEKTANFAIQDLRDPDLYLKFTQQAEGLKKVKKHDSAFKALSIAERDPLAGVRMYNEHVAKYGGEPITARQLGDNQFEVDDTDENGKPLAQKVDRTGVEHYIQLGLQSDLFDSYKDAATTAREEKTASATAAYQGSMGHKADVEAGLAPAESAALIDERRASATESLLQGRAAGATAASTNELNRARINQIGIENQAKELELQYLPIEKAQTVQKGKAEVSEIAARTDALKYGAKPGQKTVSAAVDDIFKDEKPDADGNFPIGRDPYYAKAVATGILGATNNPDAAAAAAATLLGTDPSQLALDFQAHTATGADGQVHQLTPDAFKMLIRGVNGGAAPGDVNAP